MAKVLRTMDDVRTARDEVEERVDDMLRLNGWRRTCMNPASLWLWEKTLPDGRVMLVDKDTALAFEHLTYEGDVEGTEG